MDEEKPDQVLQRLDIIISLMLENTPDVTLTEKILRLYALGLSAADIARILRKPANQIRDVLAKQRKKESRSKGAPVAHEPGDQNGDSEAPTQRH